MTTPIAIKIVIVSGQEFSVPADTDNEAIRQQLSGMGFADVAAATIQTGKRTVDGQEVQTIEFVKKAGTKGLSGTELAAILAHARPTPPPETSYYGPTHEQAALLARLADCELTFADALAMETDLARALAACQEMPPYEEKKGAALCSTLDQLTAVACSAPCAW